MHDNYQADTIIIKRISNNVEQLYIVTTRHVYAYNYVQLFFLLGYVHLVQFVCVCVRVCVCGRERSVEEGGGGGGVSGRWRKG